MQDGKTDIRYRGFACTDEGGRQFEFAVSAPNRERTVVLVDIPGILFAGTDRVLVQEGASICSAKIKELCGLGGAGELPGRLLLTGHDISQLREPPKTRLGR
jgi:hypothetical protein